MTAQVFRLDTSKPWEDQIIPRRTEKTVCVSRYGAFGDMIQTSSVLPGLKAQGYRVCVNTEQIGMDIIRNDPHIDEFLIQEKDHVPNEKLWNYWSWLSGKFDKFVIMSECVEGSLLAFPGRRAYRWNKEFRDLVMNVDYLQGMHAIAGVPYVPQPRFYRSKAETEWAERYRAKLGLNNFVLMWSIAGSSVHKVYPHMDMVMARLLHLYPNIRIVLVGDELSSIVEYDWRNEKRVIRKCGKWSIRESLSFALECDMVVGPETGVMNAVSFEGMPKALLLSHSSAANIGGSWVNTTPLAPEGVDCHPCHKIHYGFDTCCRDEETGAALCAAAISPDRVFDCIEAMIK